MSKKAFFVTGPEGSGTHMMTDALVASGCTEVLQGLRTYNTNYEHLVADFPDLVVMQRSMPANGRWPDWKYAQFAFQSHDYEVIPIFMIREFNATYQSQVRRGLKRHEGWTMALTSEALWRAGKEFDDLRVVTYEAFCFSRPFREWLFTSHFGLPMTTIEIKEGNSKYYE